MIKKNGKTRLEEITKGDVECETPVAPRALSVSHALPGWQHGGMINLQHLLLVTLLRGAKLVISDGHFSVGILNLSGHLKVT